MVRGCNYEAIVKVVIKLSCKAAKSGGMSEKKYNESVEDAALRGRLQIMIDDLGTHESTYAGHIFFNKFLDEHGPRAMMKLIISKSVVLDEEDGLNRHDFDGHASPAFRASRMKLLSRRGVFSVLAGGFAGTTYVGRFASGEAANVEKALTGSDARFRPTAEFIDQKLMLPADGAIGSVIISEAYEAWLENKLKQIAEVVWQFSKEIKDGKLDDVGAKDVLGR